jgi:hypothetical protein
MLKSPRRHLSRLNKKTEKVCTISPNAYTFFTFWLFRIFEGAGERSFFCNASGEGDVRRPTLQDSRGRALNGAKPVFLPLPFRCLQNLVTGQRVKVSQNLLFADTLFFLLLLFFFSKKKRRVPTLRPGLLR